MPNARRSRASGYNYQIIRPNEDILSWQPALRMDYQPMQKLRATFKYSGWQQRQGRDQRQLPGFNDTQMQRPVISTIAVSANYNLNNTTFLEGTYGRSRNELAGCALAQTGTGPNFCTNAIPMNEMSNRFNARARRAPDALPGREQAQPRVLRHRGAQQDEPGAAGLGERRLRQAANVRSGATGSATHRRTSRSRLTSTSTRPRTFRSASPKSWAVT